MTYPQPHQPKRSNHGIWVVVGAAVLGVFVFCGIVVAAAGNSDQPETQKTDVAKNGALAVQRSQSAAPTSAAPTSAAETTTTPPAATQTTQTTQAPTQPATKPTTTKPATKPAPKPTTKPPANNCHPSYSPCVPVASDVDCAGGSGDGPVYVTGPIRVIGPDVYRLDADKDGIACE
ncbi:hypothetical protein KZZ52_07290 [Dactylosporangium sp. AC04546]|uniref:hypothetical protein n=1 Tax=Dactylosporangium sp. AC04546 TaxID=2862460 RepID=UPI001EE0192C|nr:hypothetical protein [Dactylosporangium sp. AC04546]WVK85197.1 hypothetical protein KZZ52_07290 [Dactylosporangium sp. AC04546]